MPVQRVPYQIVGDLNNETPYLQDDFDTTVDTAHVRARGEMITSVPAQLDKGEVDREARTHVIVAMTEDGKKGYVWDVNEEENRENNYRRMRNGMNLSVFADCEFYYVSLPAVPNPPGIIGMPPIDMVLYAPFFTKWQSRGGPTV